MREKILDQFANLPTAYQRYQARRKAEGRCRVCGKEANGKARCPACEKKKMDLQRAKAAERKKKQAVNRRREHLRDVRQQVRLLDRMKEPMFRLALLAAIMAKRNKQKKKEPQYFSEVEPTINRPFWRQS